MTSNPSRRNRTRDASAANPLKAIRITVTLDSTDRGDLDKLAADKGVKVKKSGRNLSLELKSDTPEQALEDIRRLTELLAPKR